MSLPAWLEPYVGELMKLLRELLSNPTFLLILLAAALVVLGIFLARRLSKAAQAGSYADFDETDGLDDFTGDESRVNVWDFRALSVSRSLRYSFERVRRLLHKYYPGLRPAYRVPWVLTLGRAYGGKTTLLDFTEMALPAGRPGEEPGTAPPGCNWWLFDRTVVLDVEGELFLGPPDQPEAAPWPGFLRLLRDIRRRRPIDSVLLVVPANTLQHWNPDQDLHTTPSQRAHAAENLAEHADLVRQRLGKAQDMLGMRFSVYVLVTKCDLIPGFESFVGSLKPGQRREIFGWSSPDPPETPYNGGWVEAAFLSVRRALYRSQLQALGRTPKPVGVDRYITFPAAFEELERPLTLYLNQVFAISSLYEPFPLRGIYFCGGMGFDRDSGDPPHHLPHHDPDRGRPLPEYAHERVEFVSDLFTRKIVPEWTLARPAIRPFQQRRRWAKFFRALALAVFLGAPLVLLLSEWLTTARADVLVQELLAPASAEIDMPDELRRVTDTLLNAVDLVPNYRLRSLGLLFPSLESSYRREVGYAMTDLYEDYFFPTTRAILDLRLERAKVWPVGPDPAEPIYDVGATPEFQSLRGLVDELDYLETGYGLFNCFSPEGCLPPRQNRLTDFRQLANWVYDTDPVPPTHEARNFYIRFLNRVRVDPYSPDNDRKDLQNRTLTLSNAMYRRLYDENALTLDLEELAEQIDQLAYDESEALTGCGEADVPQAYVDLLDLLDRTAMDLERPELAWASRKSFDLGPEFDAWLLDVAASAFLGKSTAVEIQRHGSAEFDDYRHYLETASTEALGPMLAYNEEDERFELAPGMQGFQTALESFLGQSFMAEESDLLHLQNTPKGTSLFWRAGDLEEAVALHANYDAFMSQNLDAFAGLREAVEECALVSLEAHMLSLVAQAQEFRARPNLLTKESREAFLLQQVLNLQSVSGSLTELLGQFEPPPPTPTASSCAAWCTGRPATAWCQLSAVLESQRHDMLKDLDALLFAEALYKPRDGGFSWWDGTPNLAWKAFGVDSDDGLKQYLELQLDAARNLTLSYASPTLNAVQARDCWNSASLPVFRRWMVMLSDFGDYDNKKAGNAVDQLQGFISNSMPAITGENCLTTVTASTTCFSDLTPLKLRVEPPCDFFLGVRSGFEDDLDVRCDELTVEGVLAAYPKIETAFRNRLEKKVPFTNAESLPLVQEATPADVYGFFQVYDREHAQVERFFTLFDERQAAGLPLPWSEKALEPVREFMAEMAEVREFFAVFLEERDETPSTVPVYDLEVQFRVNRESEKYGNQIIRWTFEVGDDVILPGDIDPPGRWVFGEPVSVTLDWAENARTCPVDPDQVHLHVSGYTATFEYENAWSLVSLIKENAAELSDFPDFVDPLPETLALRIPAGRILGETIDEHGRRVVQVGDYFTVKVFLRITMLTPDGDKVEVPFPVFPVKAPPFPEPSP